MLMICKVSKTSLSLSDICEASFGLKCKFSWGGIEETAKIRNFLYECELTTQVTMSVLMVCLQLLCVTYIVSVGRVLLPDQNQT